MTARWWRDHWLDAVRASDAKPLEVFVARSYADYARDGQAAWVTLDQLCRETKLSRDAARRAVKGLTDKHLLLMVEKARQHRCAVYALVIPNDPSSTAERPLDTPSGTADVPLDDLRGTAERPLSVPRGTSPRSRGTSPVPNQLSISSPSLSPEQRQAADLLGLDARDERLALIPKILEENDVRSPRPWLRAAHQRGDLLDLLDAARNRSRLSVDHARERERNRCAHGIVNGLRAGLCPECAPHGETT